MDSLNSPAPLTGSNTLDHLLTILGALVPLFSAIAAFLNSKVRAAQSEGQGVSPALLKAAALVNVAAVNIDKANQLSSLAKKPAPQAPSAQPPAAPPAK